jgi:O-antigen/teichoic acid export membrane protein
MAVVQEHRARTDERSRRSVLVAWLALAGGVAALAGAIYVMFQPMESATASGCGTWVNPSGAEDGDGLASRCSDLQTRASVTLAVLAVLAIGLVAVGVWLLVRSRRRASAAV